MLFLYRVLTNLLYPLFVIIIFFKKFIKKEDIKRYKEKIFYTHFNPKIKNESNLIWFQAASIGEFKSILPILESLNRKYDNLEFLVTTTTLTASYLAKQELTKFHNAQHRFFPIDVKFLINKFLSYGGQELFFCWLRNLTKFNFRGKKKKYSLILINARITSKTFKRWMLHTSVAKKIFNCFSLCLSSNKDQLNIWGN